MLFNYWQKPGVDSPRLYVDDKTMPGIYLYLLKSGNLVRVKSHGNWQAAKLVEKQLFDLGLDMSREYDSINALISSLRALPGVDVSMPQATKGKAKAKGPNMRLVQGGRSNRAGGQIHDTPRSFADLANESSTIDIGKVPFRRGTKSGLEIVIDHREPAHVIEALAASGIKVRVEQLLVGDILIRDLETGDTMLIERKTILDFRQSIISSRAHSQAEAMYDYEQTMRRQGIRVRAFWFIEAEPSGMSYYDTLPQIKQMDGWECYTGAILGQHTSVTFNPHHLAAKIIKFAQGFFEQELYYPVKADTGARLDKSAKERVRSEAPQLVDDAPASHGVSKPNRSLEELLCFFPSINRGVASTLAASGLSFKEIVNLPAARLMEFKGVGKTLARKITDDFSRA